MSYFTVVLMRSGENVRIRGDHKDVSGAVMAGIGFQGRGQTGFNVYSNDPYRLVGNWSWDGLSRCNSGHIEYGDWEEAA